MFMSAIARKTWRSTRSCTNGSSLTSRADPRVWRTKHGMQSTDVFMAYTTWLSIQILLDGFSLFVVLS
jgi:hypothetical protein